MFTILVAADVHGTKLNYEFEFPAVPTLPELQRRVAEVFSAESAARRPSGVPPSAFTIQRLQVFDERVELWVELLSSSQLQEYCQVYVFQPETPYHKEVQSKLPTAVRIPSMAAAAGGAATHRSPHRSPVRERSPLGRVGAVEAAARSLPAVGHHSLPPAPPSAAHLMPVHMPQPAPGPPLPGGENPTHDDKVRAVFDELDSKRARVVEYDAFRSMFARLRIDFGSPTAADLFQKGDVNGDGVISFDEWQRFCERYPTLLDALFCRAREFWVDQRQKEGIDAAKRLLESLRARDADARSASIQATAETNGQELRLQAAVAEVAESEMREREAAAVLSAAQHDSEQARAEVAGRVSDLAGSKERVRAREMMCIEAAREVERAESMLRAQDGQTMAAEERVREIERMLEEARRECEAQRAASAARRADVATVQGQEQAAQIAKAEAEREVMVTADRLGLAEAGLGRTQERERECGCVHLAARDDTARRLSQRDAEERDLAAAREREAAKRVIEAEAARAVEAQDRMAQALEQENIEHNMVRLRVEDEERPLLEQEVRLREQRDSLEQMEQKLRSDHGCFQNRTQGRAGVGPSPRRAGPSAAELAAMASLHSASPSRSAAAHAAAAHYSSILRQQGSPPRAMAAAASAAAHSSRTGAGPLFPSQHAPLCSPATAAAAVEAAYAAAGMSPGRNAYDSFRRYPAAGETRRSTSPRRER